MKTVIVKTHTYTHKNRNKNKKGNANFPPKGISTPTTPQTEAPTAAVKE